MKIPSPILDMTAVALFYAEEHSVNMAIYEVGLGGA